MSFLGNLFDSIETGKAPPLPSKPTPKPPALTSTAAHSNPVPKATTAELSSLPQTKNLKRKVDDRDGKAQERVTRPNPTPGLTSSVNNRTAVIPINASKPAVVKPVSIASTSTSTPTIPGKAPSKGSYADILARAKQAREQRSQSQVGKIKHHATPKEKLSKAGERRRQEQEKLKVGNEKGEKARNGQKPASIDKTGTKRGASPVKKSGQPKIAKAPRPPLHAPPSYKGTMGTTSKKPRDMGPRRDKGSRYDEYLGTDEDEDSGMEDVDDGYDYGSDMSSDMEAGIDEVEHEEKNALRAAREDDARELQIENQLKREKEERRKRLAAMAAKKGR